MKLLNFCWKHAKSTLSPRTGEHFCFLLPCSWQVSVSLYRAILFEPMVYLNALYTGDALQLAVVPYKGNKQNLVSARFIILSPISCLRMVLFRIFQVITLSVNIRRKQWFVLEKKKIGILSLWGF